MGMMQMIYNLNARSIPRFRRNIVLVDFKLVKFLLYMSYDLNFNPLEDGPSSPWPSVG